MELYLGTSGYSYKEWKGRFYPERLPAKAMLGFYAQHFNAVEINSSFYRLPTPALLEQWAAQVPDYFRFAFKAPKRVTHDRRLQDTPDTILYFFETLRTLGQRRGPVLFQLPPSFGQDLPRLEAFLDAIADDRDMLAAFEFRHPSWRDDVVTQRLRERGLALCIAETDEQPTPEVSVTAPWGYFRLRRTEYSDDDLRAWIARMRAQPWEQVYVYFKHEDEAKGPVFAERFRLLWGE